MRRSRVLHWGSCPWRYENGGINYLKLAENGYTGSKDSGDWDKVRNVVIKSNQDPYLSDQYSFDGETEVEYTITGLKFLEEEVVEGTDMGHHIIYDPEKRTQI